jgi:flavodoxin
MNIAVAFATLSGNTLTVASEIDRYLSELGHTVTQFDVLETSADQLKHFDVVFIGSSTYGTGELNPISEMFFATAEAGSHHCEHTKFAIFALGDSSYPNFAESGKIILKELQRMEASIILPILTLDGFPDEAMFDKTRNWVAKILPQVTALAEET